MERRAAAIPEPAHVTGVEPAAEAVEPDRDCPLCPRLVALRAANRAAEPSWFNAPVPSFGEADARLLIVGLAKAHQVSNGKAAVAILVPALLCCICFAILMVMSMGAIMSSMGMHR